MEILVKGKRGEGSTTVAHYLYWFLRMLGYDVAIEANRYESEVIAENYFSPGSISKKKRIILRTESYEERNNSCQ